ncbi:Nischarin [Manis pentadactyla]|nr:Nischarin [Manis pentadactyla]
MTRSGSVRGLGSSCSPVGEPGEAPVKIRAPLSRSPPRPTRLPQPPSGLTRLRSHPRLGGDTFLRLEEERIRAFWLPHSLQLPGFLIDVLQIAGRLNSLRASLMDSEVVTLRGRDSRPHSNHSLTPCGPKAVSEFGLVGTLEGCLVLEVRHTKPGT